MPKVPTRQQLLDRFARDVRADQESVANVELMLMVRGATLGEDLREWLPGDVSALLLELCPASAQADPVLLAQGPADLERFLRWLGSTRQLLGAPLRGLLLELADVAPDFAAAMVDPDRSGLAKGLLGGLDLSDLSDGLDVGEQVQARVDAFNAQPYELRAAATPGLDPLVLPPVVLEDPAVLRRAAEGSVLHRRVAALLRHLAPSGRPVTATGALRLDDCRALMDVCGDEGARYGRPSVRRMADLAGVEETYELAVTAGLVSVLSRALPTAPLDPLDRVEALASAVLRRGPFLSTSHGFYRDQLGQFTGSLPALMVLLYVKGEPVTLVELAHAAEEVSQLPVDLAAAWLPAVLGRLERLDVVEQLGWHPSPRPWSDGRQEATSVRLTALGTWWLQRHLPEHGVATPLLGELASASATELARAASTYPQSSASAEVAAWCAVRGDESAAAQLAALLAHEDLTCRQFALFALEGRPGATEAVRVLLDDPRGRPYARFWLDGHGSPVDDRYVEDVDGDLLLVDTAAFALLRGHGDLVLSELAAEPGAGERVRELWRVPSPYVPLVLEAMVAGDDERLRAGARRALAQLRSDRGGAGRPRPGRKGRRRR